MLNTKKFFIQTADGEVVALCNEYSIETEKRKLRPGKYIVIGPSCSYTFEK